MSEYIDPIPREVRDELDKQHEDKLRMAIGVYGADQRAIAVGRSFELGPDGPEYIINVLWSTAINDKRARDLPDAGDLGVQIRYKLLPEVNRNARY